MISIRPYRRLQLECECQSAWLFARQPGLSALACHKGNAADTQSSTQVGSQTAGVSSNGSKNQSNTGTQVSTAPAVTGDKNSVQNGGTNVGNNSTVTTTDDGAVKTALDALSNALNDSQNALALNTDTSNGLAATIAASLMGGSADNSTAGVGQIPNPSGIQATNTNATTTAGLSTLQIVAAVLGILGALFLILRKPKTA